ncbi:hypothetical protein ACOX9P_09210 [Enterococcus durans]|uniref:hypothetical protein n=1 Tax=Enterococcus durans TaxID=53345 RepID=UPI003BEEDF1A
MNLGYIKLYRKVTSSFVWTNSDMFKLWILCLMKASHEDRKFLFNGQEVRLTSGQFVTGAHAIAKEYNEGVPSDKAIAWRTLWRWLKRFENEELLTIQSNARYSIITIKNWTDYQSSDKPVTSHGQSGDKPVTTYKNDKNDKNDKNNNNPRNSQKTREYADDDPNKKLAILLLKLIRKNQNIKEPNLDKWANTIRLTIEADKRTGKEVQDMIVWSTSDEFWSGVILSPTSLRKHFDKMTVQKKKRKSPNGGRRLENTGSDEYDDLPI